MYYSSYLFICFECETEINVIQSMILDIVVVQVSHRQACLSHYHFVSCSNDVSKLTNRESDTVWLVTIFNTKHDWNSNIFFLIPLPDLSAFHVIRYENIVMCLNVIWNWGQIFKCYVWCLTGNTLGMNISFHHFKTWKGTK